MRDEKSIHVCYKWLSICSLSFLCLLMLRDSSQHAVEWFETIVPGWTLVRSG
ncbi:hypothetical protein NOF04DRAFT_1208243 [Fusarium oxysporum II5]|nr:hypothetical protein NOF04DRAFT_1208243 [Fusarium oxysporum II5]